MENEPSRPIADDDGHSTEAVVSRNVRQWRTARGMSQGDLAERMTLMGHRMHQTQVAKLEAGTRPIRVNELWALAQALLVPVGDLIAEGTSVAPSRESHETVEEETRDVTIGKVVEGIKSSYQLRNNLIIDLSRARDELREVKERYQNVFEEAKALLARSEALQRREKDLHEKIIAVTQNMDEYQKDLVDLQGKRGAEVTNRIRGAHITSSTTSGTVSHASVTPKGDKWSIVIYVDSLVPGFPAREIHIEDTYESYESAWNAVDEWVGQNGTYAQW